ncbi:hypothetical protein ADK37_05345 [Streptomyces resistomycificus]|uniref:Uncharacterized protein n=1 Tax=Streptomyces resistomycificus TaxID=67356 RepID=A0A0L8LX55_9ACTN|nr:hypothetical protein ADK37_05345 [Streptomyces resistomycificus]
MVRVAVADRPLEDIAHLITLLEQSPEYAEATVAALRAVGVNRSVEDVTRLVTLLTRPPRDAACADEAIRAAAECRPVEEVTRLLALLHRTPLQPHCGEEAVRAAAAGRPVEELVELIGRLAEERELYADLPELDPELDPDPEPDAVLETPATLDHPETAGVPAGGPVGGGVGRAVLSALDTRRKREAAPPAPREAGPAFRPVRLAVLALVGCGVLSFPLDRDGASARIYGLALGVSVLCVFLALVLTVRPSVPTLAAAALVPAGLAAGRLFEGRLVHSAGLSRALELALAPASLVGVVAVCASFAALAALLARLAWQMPRTATPRPPAEADRAVDPLR